MQAAANHAIFQLHKLAPSFQLNTDSANSVQQLAAVLSPVVAADIAAARLCFVAETAVAGHIAVAVMQTADSGNFAAHIAVHRIAAEQADSAHYLSLCRKAARKSRAFWAFPAEQAD